MLKKKQLFIKGPYSPFAMLHSMEAYVSHTHMCTYTHLPDTVIRPGKGSRFFVCSVKTSSIAIKGLYSIWLSKIYRKNVV